MTDLFLNVLNTSFSAVWLVLGIVLVRLVLKKAPRSLVCGLWALVALRLIFGGIEAPFSLVPSAEIIPPESLFEQAPAIHSGLPVIDQAVNPVYSESLRPMPGASVNPLQVWLAVFANIWLLGMAVMALWAALSWLRVRRQVRESVPEDGVYLCDRIDSPFLFGLIRPKIYLPSCLEGDARGHVIAHEKAHLARRDHWWKPLGFLLLTVNWFNPVMWLAYILLCRDIELACDERVVRRLPVEEKKAYSSALLQCSLPRRAIAACPLAFGEVGVKQRVRSVLNYRKPTFWVIVTAAVLSVVLAVCLLTDPKPEAEDPDNWYLLTLHQNGIYSNEVLTGAAADLLDDQVGLLDPQQMTPGPGWELQQYADDSDARITIQPEQSGPSRELLRTAANGWICFIRDTGSGSSDWCFDGAFLDRFLAPYESELDHAANAIFLTADTSLSLEFRTAEHNGIVLRAGVPCLEEGDTHTHWEWEPMEDTPGFRCRPMGRQDWMEVRFHDNEVPIYHHDFQAQPIAFANGVNGTRFDSGDPDVWAYILLDTTRGQLHITAPDNVTQQTDWSAEDFQTALIIPATLNLAENGVSLLKAPAPSAYEADLGISMELVDLTPTGATLVCTRDGTDSLEVRTGSQWQLQQYRDGIWVDLLPEDIVWTAEAYPIPAGESRSFQLDWETQVGALGPGRYRIVKSFFASEQSSATRICCAEFTIAGLGITLSVEDVTRDGLTLVCTQDGTPWGQILTGSPWYLEQRTADGWVSVMPEFTAWTSVGYNVPQGQTTRWSINWSLICGSLEPGTYRISKNFSATPVQPPWGGVPGERTEETVWTEFTIE